MQESSMGVPDPETGSIQEQELRRSLALDAQELLGNYKKEREAGRDGTDIPLEFLASDVEQLKELGVLDKYKDPLTKIGADPVIRFAVLSQIDQVGQGYEEAVDKSFYLKGIRIYLELGEALGLDQSGGNPDFEGAAGLFNDFKEKYSNVEIPQPQSAPDEALALIEQGKRATSLEEYGELYDDIKDKVVNWSDENLAQLPPYLLVGLIGLGHLKPSQIINLPKDRDAVDKNNQLSSGFSSDEERDDFVKKSIEAWYLDKEEIPKMAVAALKEAYQIASTYIADFNPDQPINVDDLIDAIRSKREAVIDSTFDLYGEENWKDKMPFLGPKKKSGRQTKIAELKQAEDELSRARDLIDIAYSEKEIYEQLITPPEPDQKEPPPPDVQPVQPPKKALTQEEDAMLNRLSPPPESSVKPEKDDEQSTIQPFVEESEVSMRFLTEQERQSVEETRKKVFAYRIIRKRWSERLDSFGMPTDIAACFDAIRHDPTILSIPEAVDIFNKYAGDSHEMGQSFFNQVILGGLKERVDLENALLKSLGLPENFDEVSQLRKESENPERDPFIAWHHDMFIYHVGLYTLMRVSINPKERNHEEAKKQLDQLHSLFKSLSQETQDALANYEQEVQQYLASNNKEPNKMDRSLAELLSRVNLAIGIDEEKNVTVEKTATDARRKYEQVRENKDASPEEFISTLREYIRAHKNNYRLIQRNNQLAGRFWRRLGLIVPSSRVT